MRPTFTRTEGGFGFVVEDAIQGRRYPLRTDAPVTLTPDSADCFYFPVDSAVSIDVSELALPTVVSCYVRRPAGELVAEAEFDAPITLAEAEYVVELAAPIKLFLRVESRVEITAADDRRIVSFPEPTRVRVGARSYHSQPAATITTTADPVDALDAVSALSSSLKATSCERSYPTLRGHPPKIELGDELRIPANLDTPDTGVTIEIPPDFEHLYPVASLAFYLGADLVPADAPSLVTDEGFEYALDTSRGFEAEVERVLKHVFTLDCLTRTEGYYPIELHERTEFESHYRDLPERERAPGFDLDFAALYEETLAAQLETYLSIPFGVVDEVAPTWRLHATYTLQPENVELLPYVVNDLGIVDTVTPRDARTNPEFEAAAAEFVRGASSDTATSVRGGTTGKRTDDVAYGKPTESDALESVWVGDGRPYDAGKLLTAGFEHKFAREASSGTTDITVVCNDPAMKAECESGDLYGGRSELTIDVALHEELSTAELRELLAADTDFLHYIGHIEDDAFVCTDGRLPADDVDYAGPRAFLLNGCASYHAGVELVESGSVGGIVTHRDIGNDSAVRVGQQVARLLNRGFSLQSALSIARQQRLVGSQYAAIGAIGSEIVQSQSWTPVLCEINDGGGERLAIRIKAYPTEHLALGSVFRPYLPGIDTDYLTPGQLPDFEVPRHEAQQFLNKEPVPVLLNKEAGIRWSTSLSL